MASKLNSCIKYSNSDRILDSSKASKNLKIGIFPEEVSNVNSSEIYICSEYNYIFKIMKQKLNYNLTFIVIENSKNRTYKENTTLNEGLMLLKEEALDTVSTEYIYNDERNSVVDFFYLIPNQKLLSIISCPVMMADNSIFNVLHTFQTLVWILIFISFAFFSMINERRVKDMRNKLFIVIDYLTMLFGRVICLKNYHNKYLIIIWSIFSILIENHFLSQFQATLIVKKELRVETFQQLIEKEDIRILMNKNSYAYKIIKRDFEVLIPRIKLITYVEQYSAATIKELIEKKNVMIAEQLTILEIIKYYHKFNLIETGENLYTSLYGFATRKSLGQNLKTELRDLFKKIHLFGIYEFKLSEFAREKYLNDQKLSENEQILDKEIEDEIFLKLNNLYFGFILYAFGNLISFIILIIEIIVKKFKALK